MKQYSLVQGHHSVFSKKKQTCKPGSVPFPLICERRRKRFLSFLWAGCHHRAQATHPPASDGQSLYAGIHGLATPEMDSTQYHHCVWWALTPPSHHCHPSPAIDRRKKAVIFFSIPVPSRAPSLSEAGRPSLPGLSSACMTHAAIEQSAFPQKYEHYLI